MTGIEVFFKSEPLSFSGMFDKVMDNANRKGRSFGLFELLIFSEASKEIATADVTMR